MSETAGGASTAVVTGAAGGIGSAVVDVLLADGLRVASVDIAPTRAEGAYTITADLGDPQQCNSAIDQAAAHLGHVGCLVNCTGYLSSKTLVDTMPDEVERVLNATLLAPMNAARSVLPAMLKTGDGIIVNIGSVWALGGGASRTVYAAAKHGVLGFSRSLAAELRGTGVTVVTLSPGPVRTEMLERPGVRELYRDEDLLEPAEVAQLVRWILQAPRGLLHGANIVCGRSQPALFVN